MPKLKQFLLNYALIQKLGEIEKQNCKNFKCSVFGPKEWFDDVLIFRKTHFIALKFKIQSEQRSNNQTKTKSFVIKLHPCCTKCSFFYLFFVFSTFFRNVFFSLFFLGHQHMVLALKQRSPNFGPRVVTWSLHYLICDVQFA